MQADEQGNVRNLGGRPVGTTIIEQKEKKGKYMRMMNEISQKYSDIVKRTSTTSRVKKGELEKIVNEAKQKYDIKTKISFNTIKSRIKRKKLECKHRGTESPMVMIEPAILEIAIQRGRMNQPLTVAEGLHLANSLIKPGSELEKDVVKYLQRRGQYSTNGSVTKLPGNLLGAGYWRGFRKRHYDKLVSQ